MIDPRLLQEFNDGVQRSMTAYWRDTHPSEFERRLRGAAKSRRYNERKKAKQRGREA